MLPDEIIKYNIGQYMDFESLDKVGEEIFNHYASRDPIRVLDYLCSIRDEQRLVDAFKKYKIQPLTYYRHCWQTSGANVGFMVELFGWLAPDPSQSEEILIDFLNLDVVSTLESKQINYLLSLLRGANHTYNQEHVLKLLPFIEKQAGHRVCPSLDLYQQLDSINKLQMIHKLDEKNIRYNNLMSTLDTSEFITFLNEAKAIPRDAAICSMSIIVESSSPHFEEFLLEPSKYPSWMCVEIVRKKLSNQRKLKYLDKPVPIQPKYDLFLFESMVVDQ